MIQDNVRPCLKSHQLRALEAYWRSKRGGNALPGRRDIEPWEMRSFLSQVFLVTVTQNPMRFWFRLVGTGIEESYGDSLTGRYLDEVDLDAVQEDILDDYRAAVCEASPVYARYCYVKDDGRRLSYERLLLPLSSDGQAVDMLLGGAVLMDDAE
jgi:hypothetical protein